MGGLVFIAGTLVAYIAGHLMLKTLSKNYIVPPGPTITGLVLLGLFVFCGAIGFCDDFLKVRKTQQPRRERSLASCSCRLIVGGVFGTIALYFPANASRHGPSPAR